MGRLLEKIVRFKDVLNTFLFREPFIAISHNSRWTIFNSQSSGEAIFWSFIYLRPFNFYHHKYCCNGVATFHFSFFVFLSFDIRNLCLRTRIILGFNFLSYMHLFLMHSDLCKYLCIYIIVRQIIESIRNVKKKIETGNVLIDFILWKMENKKNIKREGLA